MVQRLKTHSNVMGVRALVLSPTRELAQQTMQFATTFSKYTDLRVCLLVGGDNMEDQVRARAYQARPAHAAQGVTVLRPPPPPSAAV